MRSVLFCVACATAGSLRVGPPARLPCPAPARSTAAACAAAPPKAGALLRVSHEVSDPVAVMAFYDRCVGVASVDGLIGSPEVGVGMRLELIKLEGGAFGADAGYGGLIARVPSVAEAVAAATACGGTVLRDTATIEYPAALVPDEPDETTTTLVVEALVADPAGYPVLLYEAAGEAPLLSGASLDVHTWKASQEWWEALGWATVRWQSHVPARAALTVNVAAAGAPTPEEMGPRGPLAGSSAAVVQLHYKYGCRKVDPRGAGLAAIVLAAADGVPPQDELEDPDCYPIEIE